MKIRDFEKAICALDCPIELDEVKLQGGHVRRFFGHRAPVVTVTLEEKKGAQRRTTADVGRVRTRVFMSAQYGGLPGDTARHARGRDGELLRKRYCF